MKVETVNTQRPDVVITLTADEADKLYAILCYINGSGDLRDFSGALWEGLNANGRNSCYYGNIIQYMETKE